MALHQAQVHLVLGTDPRRLLEEAAAEFLVPQRATPQHPFPSPPVVLALRQGGIRDDLYALAYERGVGGWYDPPLCTFQELPKWLGQTERRPLTELDRRMLLGRLVRERARNVFGRLQYLERFLSALDRLVGELVAEGVEPQAFDRALASREGRDGFEEARDDELAAVYAGYLEAVSSAARRDGRDQWADCAEAITTAPEQLTAALGGRRELRLFGLQDLRNGWRPLLRALRAHPALDRIGIYSSEALDLTGDLQPTLTRLEEPDSIARRLFGASTTTREGTVRVIAAPDVEREVEEVARRIRALADSGVPLHRMAVVARQARPYADMAAAALARFGVPATARRRHVLRDIPGIRALASLLAAAAEGWSRHGLAEVADQPYFASELDARAINAIGYARRVAGLDAWMVAFAGDAERSEAFARFAGRARSLDEPKPLSGWLGWLRQLLAEDPWGMKERMNTVPGGRFDVVRLDLQGWKGLATLVEKWSDAVAAWGGHDAPLDATAFHALLDEQLEHEIALWTSNRRGVPVLEGLAAAYRSFDHLFLVGLEGGRFPVGAPGSPLLDESERAALVASNVSLELSGEWDRRERELFRILTAAARETLTVSYARLDADGREVVRSAFLDALDEAAQLEVQEIPLSQVLTPGIQILDGAGGAAHAEYAARIELERHTGRPSPWNGQVTDPDLLARLAEEFGDGRLWSPTQLEEYAKCPWAFLSNRLLGVERLEDPEDEMDARSRGTVLHAALARFYDGEVAHAGGRPVLLLPEDLASALPRLEAALDDALAAAGADAGLGHPAMARANRMALARTLSRYLTAEAEDNAKYGKANTTNSKSVRTGVLRHERAIREAVLRRGGVVVRYRGWIDRVEVGMDDPPGAARHVAAVDYKSSESSTPGHGNKKAWEQGVVLQVPLYAHAIAAEDGAEVARVEYRALNRFKSVHALRLVAVNPRTGETRRDDAEMEKFEASLDAVVRHVLRARAGEFPADPPPACGCPSYCHARDLCRVAGGPREPIK